MLSIEGELPKGVGVSVPAGTVLWNDAATRVFPFLFSNRMFAFVTFFKRLDPGQRLFPMYSAHLSSGLRSAKASCVGVFATHCGRISYRVEVSVAAGTYLWNDASACVRLSPSLSLSNRVLARATFLKTVGPPSGADGLFESALLIQSRGYFLQSAAASVPLPDSGKFSPVKEESILMILNPERTGLRYRSFR